MTACPLTADTSDGTRRRNRATSRRPESRAALVIQIQKATLHVVMPASSPSSSPSLSGVKRTVPDTRARASGLSGVRAV
jgi:hypothetical protein